LMSKTVVSEREKQLMLELEKAGASGFEKGMDIDSDDEVEVLPIVDKANVSEEERKAVDDELESMIKEFHPRDLRKLVMTYMSQLSNMPETTPRKKINLSRIAEGIKLPKGLIMVEKLFTAMGKKSNLDQRGMKVGSMFLTQAQVKTVLMKGIKGPEDVEGPGSQGSKTVTPQKLVNEPAKNNAKDVGKTIVKETEKVGANVVEKNVQAESSKPEPLLSQINSEKLRKLIRAYMELLKNAMTLKAIASQQELPEERVRKMLVEITSLCKAAPLVDGRRSGFKLENKIFVNSTWVAKICESGLTE